MVFGMTPLGRELATYRIRSGHANHVPSPPNAVYKLCKEVHPASNIRVATGQGKVREIQGQGKVREF